MIRFGRLHDLTKSRKRIDSISILFFIFEQTSIQNFAIQLNTGAKGNTRFGQLFLLGVDSTEKRLDKIGGDYAPRTVRIKRRQGLPTDHVTLYDKGDFYKTWIFINSNGTINFKADTAKGDHDLDDRWGQDLIGLTNDSKGKLRERVLPEIREQTISKLLQ